MCKLHGTFIILENVVSNGVSLGSVTPTISNLDQLGVLHYLFLQNFMFLITVFFPMVLGIHSNLCNVWFPLMYINMPNTYCLVQQSLAQGNHR